MKRLILSLSCSLALSLGVALADDFKAVPTEELALKDDPSAAGAHAMILEYRELRDDNEDFEEIYKRIKIFTEKGKEQANIEIPYLKNSNHITGIKARVIHPDGGIANFEGKIFDKLIIKSRSIKFRAKAFVLPDVQPGSVIEYKYRRVFDDYFLHNNTWSLQEDMFMKKAYFKLIPYSRFGSYWMTFGIPGGKEVKKKGGSVELELENVPAFTEERYTPPDRYLKPRVEFFYSKVDIEKEPAKFWERIGKELYSDLEDYLNKKDQMRQAAASIVAAGDSAETKLRKLYAKVQGMRNLTFEREKTAQEEKREKLKEMSNIKEVWDRGYGDRWDLNRLFVGLARGAGFEAAIIKVSRRDSIFFQQQLTDASQLNDEISWVSADGKEYFLEPGRPHCPFGMLGWSRTATTGLKLTKNGGTFIKTPDPDISMAVTKRMAQLTYTETGLKGRIEVTYTGFDALERRLDALTDDEQSYREDLEEELKKSLPEGSTVKLANMINPKGVEEPLIAQFEVEVPDVSSQVGSRRLLPAAIFQMNNSNPFQQEERKHPVYFGYPFQELDQVTIELPAGYTIDTLPSNRLEEAAFGRYDTNWIAEGRLLTMQRRIGIYGVYFANKYYGDLRAFYNKAATGDQDSAVLRLQSASK